jgi:hypothetical protein
MLGKSITFPTTNRHHSGVYECTAENSEGEPSKAIINLQITCELGRRLTHSGAHLSRRRIYRPTQPILFQIQNLGEKRRPECILI